MVVFLHVHDRLHIHRRPNHAPATCMTVWHHHQGKTRESLVVGQLLDLRLRPVIQGTGGEVNDSGRVPPANQMAVRVHSFSRVGS